MNDVNTASSPFTISSRVVVMGYSTTYIDGCVAKME